MTTNDFISDVRDRIIAELKPWVELQVETLYKKRIEKATLSIEEASEYIGISKTLLYEMAREKEIPCFGVGRVNSKKPTIKFRLSSLDKWMEEREKKVIDGEGVRK